MSIRMKASDKTDVYEQYNSYLGTCLKQGVSALLLQDHTLCVQNLLSEGDVQVLFRSLGVDLLAVMKASIQNADSGLEGLAKAFEVLELAAINLYLCPWRKEYRTIKMFSGTYIHQVAPVLSEQQAAMFFGLLGYQVAEGQRLELRGQPTAEQLRRLACAFFLARCECRLLLGVGGSPGGGLVFEQALVKEGQKGRGLQEARSDVVKQLEVREQELGELDLYRAEEWNGESQSDKAQAQDHVCGMSLYSSGSTLPAGGSSNISVQDEAVSTTISDQLNQVNDPAGTHCSQQEEAARSVKTEMSRAGVGQLITSQASGNDRRAAESSAVSHGGRTCLILYCEQCCIVHSINCPEAERCERLRHRTRYIKENTTQQERAGGVQDPMEHEKLVACLKRHTCLEEGLSCAPDPMCEQDQHCSKAGHAVLSKRSPEPSEHTTPQSLTPQFLNFHSCDPGRFNTRVSQDISCSDLKLCEHLQQDVVKKCTNTNDCVLPIRAVCKYCHVAYCKSCWFRCPITCECGQIISLV
ncbi:spermatogenesis associated 2-like [Brienomyrus brachyistius]|uniref:spermatogenesis associated 2-like n=1 Tax=Brienomyrus brachyistius TaxID=42636 RepID=UPI0020B194F6|nr:spermatogenesis associated 2-like [Brienomyrus brachyistius]